MSVPSSSGAGWPPRGGRAQSRSTSGSSCGRSSPHRPPSRSETPVDEPLIRSLTPSVLGVLVRRGADFAAAEDAVQEALVEALRAWPADPPRDAKGWLVTVAWRKFLDATRSDTARRRREDLVDEEPAPGP